ncbi:hypothetical protein BDV3_007260 [Batrachochytrium dendrobatidis]|nr:hypothetical protein BDEG_25666 [Batrachochytrium dendrobatidis JEL423]
MDRWNKLRDSFRFVSDFENNAVARPPGLTGSWWDLDERSGRKTVLTLYRKQSIPKAVFDFLSSWLPGIIFSSSAKNAQPQHQTYPSSHHLTPNSATSSEDTSMKQKSLQASPRQQHPSTQYSQQPIQTHYQEAHPNHHPSTQQSFSHQQYDQHQNYSARSQSEVPLDRKDDRCISPNFNHRTSFQGSNNPSIPPNSMSHSSRSSSSSPSTAKVVSGALPPIVPGQAQSPYVDSRTHPSQHLHQKLPSLAAQIQHSAGSHSPRPLLSSESFSAPHPHQTRHQPFHSHPYPYPPSHHQYPQNAQHTSYPQQLGKRMAFSASAGNDYNSSAYSSHALPQTKYQRVEGASVRPSSTQTLHYQHHNAQSDRHLVEAGMGAAGPLHDTAAVSTASYQTQNSPNNHFRRAEAQPHHSTPRHYSYANQRPMAYSDEVSEAHRSTHGMRTHVVSGLAASNSAMSTSPTVPPLSSQSPYSSDTRTEILDRLESHLASRHVKSEGSSQSHYTLPDKSKLYVPTNSNRTSTSHIPATTLPSSTIPVQSGNGKLMPDSLLLAAYSPTSTTMQDLVGLLTEWRQSDVAFQNRLSALIDSLDGYAQGTIGVKSVSVPDTNQ